MLENIGILSTVAKFLGRGANKLMNNNGRISRTKKFQEEIGLGKIAKLAVFSVFLTVGTTGIIDLIGLEDQPNNNTRQREHSGSRRH